MMLCTFPDVPRCTAWMEETGGQQSLFQHQEIRTVTGSTAHTASPICNSQWQCWGPRLPSFQLLWKTTNAQMLSFGDQTAGGQAAGNTHAMLWRYMALGCKMHQCFPSQPQTSATIFAMSGLWAPCMNRFPQWPPFHTQETCVTAVMWRHEKQMDREKIHRVQWGFGCLQGGSLLHQMWVCAVSQQPLASTPAVPLQQGPKSECAQPVFQHYYLWGDNTHASFPIHPFPYILSHP